MNQAMETPFRAIRQIGLVTGDLDRFIQNMENLYHLRPDRTAFVPVGATKENLPAPAGIFTSLSM